MTFRLSEPPAIDLMEIRRAAAGHSSRLRRSDALRRLAASDFPGRHRDLDEILGNEENAEGLRSLAAVLLARQTDGHALPILARHADHAAPDVLDHIVRAIGQIGDQPMLTLLDRIQTTAPAWIGSHASFAAALIAYRHRLDGRAIELPPDLRIQALPGESRMPVAIDAPDEGNLAASLAAAEDEPYGISYDARHAIHLTFERDRWTILLSRECFVRDGLEQLSTRKALLGTVMERVTTDPEYAVALLVLSTPMGDGRSSRLHLHDVDGVLLYTGTAIAEPPQLRFSLNSIPRPLAIPLDIEGRLGEDGLHLDRIHTASIAGRKRRIRRATIDS